MPKIKRKKKTVSTAHLDGDRKAKAVVAHQLQRIIKSIDREEDSKGKLPHGCIRRIYEEERRTLEWLSIHQIYGLRRRKAEKIKEEEERAEEENKGTSDDDESDDEIIESTATAIGVQPPPIHIGRKKGSTLSAKEDAAKQKQLLIEDISFWWKNIKQDPANGTQLFELIAIRKTLADMEDVDIKEPTIISRVRRNNIFNVKPGPRKKKMT